jgi:hypothetical protein
MCAINALPAFLNALPIGPFTAVVRGETTNSVRNARLLDG